MGTALDRSEAETRVSVKAESNRIPSEVVDGMDVMAVNDATRRAVDVVRSGDGPRLLEFQTYRYRAHSMSDPDLYRPKEEVERWKQRDPIALLQERLRSAGQLSDQTASAIDMRVAAAIDAAVAAAEEGPWEPLEDLEQFVMTG
jgi:TPP-dependent pyruvate/acetoin dehydrogenase alpha subunit